MDKINNTPPAKVSVGNKSWDFPVLKRNDRPGCRSTFRSSTASRACSPTTPASPRRRAAISKITYIDGDKGELLYRGFPIEQLAENGDFLETCYLLLYGELPTKAQKADFDYRVTRHTMVHDQMARFFQGFRRDAHPMAVMVGCVGALAAFYHDSTDISDPHQRMVASMRMIAKLPTMAAMAYKYHVGQPFVYPKNSLDYASNFLNMCFAVPCEEYKINPVMARALDRIFILHADHEQNASTSTVRLAGLLGRQSVRLHRRRHRLPLGPRPWRRQRSRAADADGDRHARRIQALCRQGQGQERSVPPDGLRPSRLQELRSARQDHAADLP